MSRIKAFKKAHQAAWIPADGDKVYLPPRSPYLSSMLAVVLAYDPEWKTVKVSYSVNRRQKEIWLKIEDVRPTPPRFNRKPAVK